MLVIPFIVNVSLLFIVHLRVKFIYYLFIYYLSIICRNELLIIAMEENDPR